MDTKLILDLHGRFLQGKMEETRQKIAFLEKDQRQDEANLYKARRNVFDIFHKMLGASLRKQGEGALEAYQGHLDAIPQSWIEARKQAVEHGDIHRQAVEDMKLSAVKEIVQQLHGITEKGGRQQ